MRVRKKCKAKTSRIPVIIGWKSYEINLVRERPDGRHFRIKTAIGRIADGNGAGGGKKSGEF